MSVREDEREGSRVTAELKRKAREAKRARAAELAAQGLTPAEIAGLLRVSRETVGEWLRAGGVRYRRARGDGELGMLANGLP